MEITYGSDGNAATNLVRDTLIDVMASSSEYDPFKVAEEWPKVWQIHHPGFHTKTLSPAIYHRFIFDHTPVTRIESYTKNVIRIFSCALNYIFGR
jgi:hypothetical protein